MLRKPARLVLLALSLAACGGDGPAAPGDGAFAWRLPEGFPEPRVPADNPMSDAAVELGRHLFYDVRLSLNGTTSCATCHEQARAFTDGKPVGIGATGEAHPRNSMSLANVGYGSVLTWGNPNERTLEHQALTPMFGEAPVELGLAGREDSLFAMLQGDPTYQRLFPEAYPADTPLVSLATITRALGAFQRMLISGNSPYDRYRFQGQAGAISPAARRGEALFFNEALECFHCHGGFNFTGSTDYVGKGFTEIEFFNTGLYNLGGNGDYPAPNVGILQFTGQAIDMGKFKAPTLRNVAVTAPYMHDGSIATLDEVLDHYAAGGRTIGSGPSAGIGSANPYKNGFVKGFTLSAQDRADLLALLESLTDSTFLTERRFANPWKPGSPGNP
jgi:cytochrome c peroxidase